jgi:micrococcal nuclease
MEPSVSSSPSRSWSYGLACDHLPHYGQRPCLSTGELARTPTGLVVKVVDGTTIDFPLDGRKVRVGHIGMNTRETEHPTRGAEPFGPESAKANRRLVESQTVHIELDVQPWVRYWRLLAYVYVGETMINAEVVCLSYAQVATFPPNVRYQDRFLTLQREAQEAQRGLWGQP